MIYGLENTSGTTGKSHGNQTAAAQRGYNNIQNAITVDIGDQMHPQDCRADEMVRKPGQRRNRFQNRIGTTKKGQNARQVGG